MKVKAVEKLLKFDKNSACTLRLCARFLRDLNYSSIAICKIIQKCVMQICIIELFLLYLHP